MRLVLFMLVQVASAPTPPARVEVTPRAAELEIGQTLQLTARALDAQGQPVREVAIRWFVASDNG
ncbi:MAG TPA: hypothetical protein VGA20_06255, partial [Gemmatimonadales bacterium]